MENETNNKAQEKDSNTDEFVKNITDKATEYGEKLGKQWETTREQFSDANVKTQKFVEEKPWEAIGIAFGVAFCVGVLLGIGSRR